LSEFIEFNAASAKHHLLFQSERNRAVVDHAEGNLDAFQNVAYIDRRRFIPALRNRQGVIENDPDNLMNGNFRLGEKDRLWRSCPGIGDFCGEVLTVSDFRRNLAATNCLGSEQGKPGLILGFMISHQVQLVIPAKAGIQWGAALDTGFRRCDEEK